MGNSQSQLYDIVSNSYTNYYPKSRYLRATNVSTTLMISGIGAQLFVNKRKPYNHSASFVFLASTGANLGLQIWVSFISGMTMIRLLPRQQFGLVQSHLFPKYFFLSSFFSFASFFTFLGMNPVNTWKDDILILGYLLGGSFLLNLFNFSFVNIKTIEYSSRMREIEKLTGEDLNVIGRLKSDSKIENDPAYKKAKKSFLFYHGISVTTNLVSILSNIGQLYILSGKGLFSF